MTKNPVCQFVLWSFLLSHPVFAQEAIQIEIDSAPVEVEIRKPAEPVQPAQPEPPVQAEKAPQPATDTEGDGTVAEEDSGMGKYGVAIGIGALVAGVLAALAGGGGGSGGGSSTPSH